MKHRAFARAGVLAASLMGILAVAGCDAVLSSLTNTYRGPKPGSDNLVSEVVIIRSINRQPSGAALLVVDRVRYPEAGDPHDVNRIIKAFTTQVQPEFEALNVRTGSRLVVSTSFIQVGEAAELFEVPNWPGHGYVEYPIGLHYLTSIARPVQ